MKRVSLKEIAKHVRKDILTISFNAHMGHIGSAFSVVEILVVLYFKVLNIHKNNLTDLKRDRFILSKGHAGSALYSILFEKGIISKDQLHSFCRDGSQLLVHPEWNGLPGIEHGTGSLGHGLPVGVGMAYAAKLLGQESKVFVLLSDLELDEGTTWEAALFAGHHKLDNLVIVLDYNGSQALGKKANILDVEPLEAKWKSFNFATETVAGHNLKELIQAIQKHSSRKPKIVIAQTTIGKGVDFMEGDFGWHYYDLKSDQFKAAIRQLKL